MTASIRVDDEVERALAQRASEEGLALFSPDTPNLVLRILLGLDHSRSPSVVRSLRSPDNSALSNKLGAPIQDSRTIGRTHQRIGSRLLREHDLNCAKGYFSKTGIPYQKPDNFPVVLFDTNGYVIISDDESMRSNPYINVGKQVSIPNGIDSIPGYTKCQHEHA